MQIEGRDLSLSNLDKVLYPADGFTKAEVIDYYTRIAPVLLPHLHNRAATRVRFPDGVGGPSFFEKNAPNHTPDWVRTVTLPAPGSTKDREEVRYVVVADLPTLVWLANLAALELHVHQWQVAADGSPGPADRLVLDLDPGAPAALPECAQVALLREELGELGLDPVVKTSGSKGLQLYVGLRPTPVAEVHTWAKALAERMADAAPDRIVHRMEKALRGGKVLIDWSQNAGAKTTVAPYSLRAREHPTVSTPVDWDEVAQAAAGEPLAFTAGAVLDRVAARGDLFGGLLHDAAALP
ncbi:MAG TPA: non-homologous end-joining DNA ligase [Sporichthyaceae bacterium]|nr:non-homologous end-joining DNA ligase [Sporichthyaceae bacterium]